MLIVPTQAIPNQTFQVTLDQQQVSITLRQSSYGLFADIVSNNTPIANGQICENENRLLKEEGYRGFIGDFVFFDTLGEGVDPIYAGLGVRFLLIYLEAADIP